MVRCSEWPLKVTALVFMVVDHVHTYLELGPEWVSLLPRFVAPLFVYFLVEGFYHTRHWNKYFQRVFAFALLMLAGNMGINVVFHTVNYLTGEQDWRALTNGNNIFMTLAVYLLIMKCLQLAQQCRGGKRLGAALGVILLAVLSLPFCEGSFYLLPLLFVFYFAFGKKKWVYVGVAAWSLLLFVKAVHSYAIGATGISLYSTLCFDSEWAMIGVLLPIFLYSGERGRNDAFAKWLFYVVYPLHLWVLMIASKVMIG